MEYAEEEIVEMDWFYEAMLDRVEEFVWGLANDLEVVMLVGHNPTWTVFYVCHKSTESGATPPVFQTLGSRVDVFIALPGDAGIETLRWSCGKPACV